MEGQARDPGHDVTRRDPGQLRVSDADRHAVAEVLRKAAGEGRIDLDELDERRIIALDGHFLSDEVPVEFAHQPGERSVAGKDDAGRIGQDGVGCEHAVDQQSAAFGVRLAVRVEVGVDGGGEVAHGEHGSHGSRPEAMTCRVKRRPHPSSGP